jgi:hypothetical protein
LQIYLHASNLLVERDFSQWAGVLFFPEDQGATHTHGIGRSPARSALE